MQSKVSFRSISKLFLITVAFVATTSINAHAQSNDKPLSPERVGVETADALPLTLHEALRLALENNNDIRTSRIDVEKAEHSLTARRGAYDPQIFSETYFERSSLPVASFFGAENTGKIEQKNFTSRVGLSGLTPKFGGSYTVDVSSTRLSSNNFFNALDPAISTRFGFSYTQPLVRGLRTDDTRRQIEIAKKDLALTDVQFRQRATDVITKVEHAYWQLVHALKSLQVQTEAVKTTRAQVETNKRQVAQGVLAPIDVVEAEAQVKIFEQNVYAAQEEVTRAENALKTLMLAERNAQLWSRALLPVTPVNLEAPRMHLSDAVSTALQNRFELAELRTSADINEVNKRFYRDQTKPQIDLQVSYSSNDGQPWSILLGQDNPTARVGVRISLPLKNRTAKAELGHSLAEGRRLESVRAQMEQVIEADVRNTIQRVRSVEARMSAAAAAREAAEQQYTSEQRRFQAGMSTVFLVLQRQTDLVMARGRELETQTDLNKAIADFQRATGNTFRYRNVAVISDLKLQQDLPDSQN
ncbi:MAG TPA: TolC family protein [Pyrinomonadaceae bacterium]|nr:TolC family protein [Pyrinomonadaceae bacterium]